MTYERVLNLYDDLAKEVIARAPEAARRDLQKYGELLRVHQKFIARGELNPILAQTLDSLNENWGIERGDKWLAIDVLSKIGIAFRGRKRTPDLRDIELFGYACESFGAMQNQIRADAYLEKVLNDDDLERHLRQLEAERARNRKKGNVTQSNRKNDIAAHARKLASDGKHKTKREAAIAIRQGVIEYARKIGHPIAGTRLRTIEDMLTEMVFGS